MCVCMYVCMHVCMHAFIHTSMNECMCHMLLLLMFIAEGNRNIIEFALDLQDSLQSVRMFRPQDFRPLSLRMANGSSFLHQAEYSPALKECRTLINIHKISLIFMMYS